jgi:hypothetical protein
MNRRHQTDSDRRQPRDSDEEDSPYSLFSSAISIVVLVIAVVLGLLAARAKVLHY